MFNKRLADQNRKLKCPSSQILTNIVALPRSYFFTFNGSLCQYIKKTNFEKVRAYVTKFKYLS